MTPEISIDVPLRFVLHGGGLLCCPVCGDTYVHLGPLGIEQGKTLTVVTGDATTISPSDRERRARGSLVKLDFYGECGHVFTYSLEFHKGQVFLGLAAKSDEGISWETLWRN